MKLPFTKKNKDQATLKQEYMQACFEAGELNYKIREFTKALKKVENRIEQINIDFSKTMSKTQPEVVNAPAQAQAK
jgi:hypothetical protein